MGTCSQSLNFEAALHGAAQPWQLQEALGSSLQPFRRSAALHSGVHVVEKPRTPPSPGQQEGHLASAIPALTGSWQLNLGDQQAGMGGSCRAAPTLLCHVFFRSFVQRKSPLSLARSLLQHRHRRHRRLSWLGQLTQVPGETFILAAA